MHSGPPHHSGPPRPYSYPSGPPRPPFAQAAPDEAASFAPTIVVNAACIGLVVISLLLFLLMARLLIATVGTTSGLVAVGHGLAGIAALSGAIGVRSGRLSLAVVGLLSCPLAGVASLFALLTGSIAGIAGGAASFITLVLVVISLGDVSRMGAARRALRRGLATEVAPPSGPLSADLPRVRPRRWPVVVVLLAIVVLGGGGAAFGVRYAARAEREKEVTAFRALEECLLGGGAGPDVAPSLAYRRMEIRLAVAPPSTNPWPARCATHAHALHEAKRRAGTDKEARDAAFFAEHLGRLLADPRDGSVYKAVDDLWAAAAQEGYASSGTIGTSAEAGPSPPPWLDIDALGRVTPFSKPRMSLKLLRSDRIPAPALHVLVDGSRQLRSGRLCTLDGVTFRCQALASPLDETELSLSGGSEETAAPLLFANGGQAGIFRPSGEVLAELASYGGYARADGSTAIVGYDRRASKFVALRAENGAAPKRTLFPLKGVTDDRHVALLDDNLVWATSAGVSVARLLRSGEVLGAATELGGAERLGFVESMEGCRSSDAFFVLVHGSRGSALAIDTGDRWSPLVPVGGGTFDCSGKEVLMLDQEVRLGGTGAISLERCTAAGCTTENVDLDEVFQQNVELLPKVAPLAVPLDGKLLLVWRAGLRGGVRMRLAPVDHIAATEDVIVFDDRIQNGRVSERSNLLELRGWSRQGRAIVFLGTTSGVWPLVIDTSGKVTPIDTVP
ncbi:MAG: hypothetical protein KIT84_19605 [Labilithrix sp.]|nr:hypothetical protein [Labilithrix sp.]MCW5813243.1 hypothetical protein [Labilithrix sp.]